jgi:pimeloyl-ACP methyl ester carboxylesterase
MRPLMRPQLVLLLAPLLLVACGPSVTHGTTGPLTYDVAGKGPVVVLIPDSAGRAVWAGQFKALAKNFEVVQYDPTGNADALGALLDHLAITKASLVALGSGAVPALDYTIAHPDRVEGLMLVSPHMAAEHTPIPASLPQPVSIVVGTKGDSAAELGLDTLRAHLGGVEAVTMPGATHQVNVERAKSFNAVLLQFLYRIHPEPIAHSS